MLRAVPQLKIATFRFDYEYELDNEYDFLETFRLEYEYGFDYSTTS